jgi:predicted sugar kinase
VGQSSWGPALYGFSRGDAEEREALAERLRGAWGLEGERVFWTRPARRGAEVREEAG